MLGNSKFDEFYHRFLLPIHSLLLQSKIITREIQDSDIYEVEKTSCPIQSHLHS